LSTSAVLIKKGILMIIRRWRAMLALSASTAAAATGLTLALAGASAGAAPLTQIVGSSGGAASSASTADPSGDNGTVKIHDSTTPVTDMRNEPHVCVFYLDAFGFDPGQSVSWSIKSWPPTGDRTVVASGTLTLDSQGNGRTDDMTLPDGHYKLFWNFTAENGSAKHKMFWVSCETTSPSPSPSPSPSSSTYSSPPSS
jgi:hypothetical protein